MMKSSDARGQALEDWTRWACCFLLLAGAAYSWHAYNYLLPAFQQHPFYSVLFWDSQVFSNAGEAVAHGRDPYLTPAVTVPLDLPFFSAPSVAATLGLLYSVFGTGLAVLLKLGHLAAVVLTPLILTRLFIGRSAGELAWGYGLFLAGLGALTAVGPFGVTTVIAGNFGSVLYLAIFAAMAHGLRSGKWYWFHVAVAVAVQVKPPYGLLWIVPVLSNGWSWRQALHAAIAAVAAAAVFLVFYFVGPDLFREWLGTLVHNVDINDDFGFSFYGAARYNLGPSTQSIFPYALHIGLCAAILLFLTLDRNTGTLKAAALTAFAILANPRMKEYDVAFAIIPVAALVYSVLAPPGVSAARRAAALGAITLAMIGGASVVFHVLPRLGPYSYALGVTAGILCLAFPRPRDVGARPVT